MSHILIPVDFSETSASAARFGSHLAEAMNLDLFLLHVFDTVLGGDDNMTTRAYNQRKKELEATLEHFVEEVIPLAASRSNTTLKVKLDVLEGAAARHVLSLSHQDETACIVMGSVGAGAGLHPPGMFGSVARPVSLRGGCPVVLIPKDYGSLKIARLAIAFNNIDEVKRIGYFARRFIKALSPEVYFVHMSKPDRQKEHSNEAAFLELSWGTDLPGYTFRFDALPHGDLVDALMDYTREKDINLLVLGNKRRNFWQRLFERRRLKPVIQGAEVPVLVIPYARREA